MRRRGFNCGTFEVASSMDVSGRATAEEIDRGPRTRKREALAEARRIPFPAESREGGRRSACEKLRAVNCER